MNAFLLEVRDMASAAAQPLSDDVLSQARGLTLCLEAEVVGHDMF